MSVLVLTTSQALQIGREGSEAFPNECCGIMIGRLEGDRRVVVRLEPMANVFDAQQQKRRFAVDPLALMRAEKSAGGDGLLVLGFYHSHPDHPARPSEFDRQHAWPFYSYAIVSIMSGKPANLTSWVLEESTEQFVEERIEEVNATVPSI